MKEEYLELEDIIDEMDEPNPEREEWQNDMYLGEIPENYLVDPNELETKREIQEAIDKEKDAPYHYFRRR